MIWIILMMDLIWGKILLQFLLSSLQLLEDLSSLFHLSHPWSLLSRYALVLLCVLWDLFFLCRLLVLWGRGLQFFLASLDFQIFLVRHSLPIYMGFYIA